MGAQLRDERHDMLPLQLHGVAGEQVMGTHHGGLLQGLALPAGQHLQQPLGDVPDIGAAGPHDLIVHRGEHLRKLLAGAGHGVLRRIELVGDVVLHRLQIVQVLHHHFVYVKDLGGGLAGFPNGLFIQPVQLGPGLLHGAVKPALLRLGRQPGQLLIGGQLHLLIQPCGADGHPR